MVLRKFTREDIPEFLSWLKDTGPEFLILFSGPRYYYPLDEKQMLGTLATGDYIPFASMEDRKTSMIGHCQLTRMDYKKGTVTIGRVLIKPEERGKGFGYTMMQELIGYIRREYSFSKVYLNVYDFNSPAICCYKRLGFVEKHREDIHLDAIGKKWTCIHMELGL